MAYMFGACNGPAGPGQLKSGREGVTASIVYLNDCNGNVIETHVTDKKKVVSGTYAWDGSAIPEVGSEWNGVIVTSATKVYSNKDWVVVEISGEGPVT